MILLPVYMELMLRIIALTSSRHPHSVTGITKGITHCTGARLKEVTVNKCWGSGPFNIIMSLLLTLHCKLDRLGAVHGLTQLIMIIF